MATEPGEFRRLVDEFERSLILAALGNAGGSQKVAAAALGLVPTTLNEMMKRLSIPRPHAARLYFEDSPEFVARAVVEQDFRWQGRLGAGQAIELWALDGRITAEPARGPIARVHAQCHRDGDAPFSIKIEAIEHTLGVLVRVRYAIPPGELGADTLVEAGRARVDFRVHVPSGVCFVARTLRGQIEIRGLDASVDARVARGGVRFLSPATLEQLSGAAPGAASAAGS
jgi:hypothetical protein